MLYNYTDVYKKSAIAVAVKVSFHSSFSEFIDLVHGSDSDSDNSTAEFLDMQSAIALSCKKSRYVILFTVSILIGSMYM